MKEYFKEMYENARGDWNVEESLKQFGNGKSNEGTEESNAIKRYYVEPKDKRFEKIFLNFNSDRNIESIVWFFYEKGESLTLANLKELFGAFKMHNVIYDETTDLTFRPISNRFVKCVRSSILEWVETRKDGTMYFIKEKKEFDIFDDYRVSHVTFIIENSA
jgi:hypothetical protein